METKKILSSKIFLGFLLVLALFFGNLKYKQWRLSRAVNAEKEKLAQQMRSLQQKNQELSQSLSYLNSTSFKERVARQQLGLKKEGETVYNFTASGGKTLEEPSEQNERGNFEKWVEYFFGNN